MKVENKGITLVALIITIIVLLILATVSISLVINNGILDKAQHGVDKYSEEEELEQIKLAVSSAMLKGNGFLNKENLDSELQDRFGEEAEAKPIGENWKFNRYKIEHDGKVSGIEELIFTDEVLEKGLKNEPSGSKIEIITANIDGNECSGLSIIGRSNRHWNDPDKLNNCIRWYINVDLTGFNTLEFYAKKGADHGIMAVYVDDQMLKSVPYREFSEIWNKYVLNLENYSGEHIISFVGGYTDFTGNSYSNTQYCNIKLYEKKKILPAEYQQVEYIESSGTQWIDTMIVPSNVTNFKILIEMQGTNVGRNGCQRYNYKGTNYWCLAPNFGFVNDVSIQCGPGATEALVDSNSTTQRHIYGIDVQELKYIYDSNQIKNNNISNINAIDSFFIFASNYNESAQYFNSSKLYNCKIYNGDLIIKCFIPCYSKTTVTDVDGIQRQEGTVGLYDTVEGKFYTNKGTGSFGYGMDDGTYVAPQ